MTAPALDRLIFKTSRLAEFCSQRELINQTGHGVEDWPLVVLKEVVDNALDACEEADIAPVIEIVISDDVITVADNGPGIAPDTVASILDFTARVSSREAYVSPTRGAQGNALKTLLAMPFALDGERGETAIESRGIAHRIRFSVDSIRQEPRISHVCEASLVITGSRVTVSWPDSACSILDHAQAHFLQIAENYTWANPHLTLSVAWDRGGYEPTRWTIAATDPAWRKWRPSDPTSPHWYDEARLARLMAAYIAHDEDHDRPGRTVRAFVSEFRGLSGTAKARDICAAVGASRLSLAEFYGDWSRARVSALLGEMRQQSRQIKPRDLGLIGAEHLRAKFESIGVASESFYYKRAEVEYDGVPDLAEAAFGYCPHGNDDRRIITGVNWSVAIGGDPFRRLGAFDESLGSILTKQRAGPREPIVAFLHLACPRIDYLDRGKSSVSLPRPPGKAIIGLVEGMTERWARQRKAEERDESARLRRADRLIHRDRPTSIKAAAYSVMEQAYLAASANGTLPANPRQIMYAARPDILAITGKDSLDSQYFCQTLLVDYIREHNLGWDVVWDDRGHFVEPHTRKEFGVGTLNVRGYVATYASPSLQEAGFADATIETHGPEGRFGGLLYIEKEGFMPLLERAKMAEKFDIGIMSCKGMSVTAARQLVDRTCARYGIPLLILHDFDISGFSIAKTLCSDTRRYSFRNEFQTIELGLRLDDVRDLELESEPVSLAANKDKTRETLWRNGANEDEIDFLLNGQRVELNAMTSDQFLDFVEDKFISAGIEKIVPPKDQLDEAYRLFTRSAHIKKIVDEAIAAHADEAEVAVPDDLEARVRDYLAQEPEAPWEDAVRHAVHLD